MWGKGWGVKYRMLHIPGGGGRGSLSWYARKPQQNLGGPDGPGGLTRPQTRRKKRARETETDRQRHTHTHTQTNKQSKQSKERHKTCSALEAPGSTLIPGREGEREREGPVPAGPPHARQKQRKTERLVRARPGAQNTFNKRATERPEGGGSFRSEVSATVLCTIPPAFQ